MKKVVSIIALALIVLLVGSTIALACIKTSSEDVIDHLTDYDKVSYVSIYKDGSYYQAFTKNDEDGKNAIDKIVQLHKESLKDNLLSSLFQGATGFDEEMTVLSTSLSRNEIVKDKYCISFNFAEKQLLKWQDEEVSVNNKVVEYNEIIMEVSNNNNYGEVNIYVMNLGNKASVSNTSAYKFSAIAHQNELYDYINQLEFAGN